VILDIFSRYVVGWTIAPTAPTAPTESADLANDLTANASAAQRAEPGALTVHADRGSSMTSHQVAELLALLGAGRSHSRPHVRNDCEYQSIASGWV